MVREDQPYYQLLFLMRTPKTGTEGHSLLAIFLLGKPLCPQDLRIEEEVEILRLYSNSSWRFTVADASVYVLCLMTEVVASRLRSWLSWKTYVCHFDKFPPLISCIDHPRDLSLVDLLLHHFFPRQYRLAFRLAGPILVFAWTVKSSQIWIAPRCQLRHSSVCSWSGSAAALLASPHFGPSIAILGSWSYRLNIVGRLLLRSLWSRR